jgi:hypothetical protein
LECTNQQKNVKNRKKTALNRKNGVSRGVVRSWDSDDIARLRRASAKARVRPPAARVRPTASRTAKPSAPGRLPSPPRPPAVPQPRSAWPASAARIRPVVALIHGTPAWAQENAKHRGGVRGAQRPKKNLAFYGGFNAFSRCFQLEKAKHRGGYGARSAARRKIWKFTKDSRRMY